MSTKKCLICRKELEWDDIGLVYDAGFMVVSFHYGSRHDQIETPLSFKCASWAGEKQDKLSTMLRSDEIRAFICDDCFESNLDLFEGYRITVKRKETKVI
jgi:hypothetical protein